MPIKILISGAGIGGLTAALCLEKSGHEVVVFEQAEELVEHGAGIQCGANAIKVFQYLGLQTHLESVAVQPTNIQFRDCKTGASLYHVELGLEYAQRYGAPYYHLHRADLIEILLNKVKQKSKITLRLASRVVKVVESDNVVELILDNNDRHSGDLLIGCDGIKSLIRKSILGKSSARFTGNVAWRATVPVSDLPSGFMDKVTTGFVGAKKHMVLYYLRDCQLLNMVGVVERSEPSETSWVTKAPWEEFSQDFSGWHPMVTTAIDAVDKAECYRWALYDHPPIKRWSSKRITLLGDAAHATLPFMASGAAMAIEDARILERCINSESDIKTALIRYERNRKSRTAKVQSTSRRLGSLYHIQNPLILKTAFAGLRMLGGSKEDFLPMYDANTVILK